MPSVVNPDPTLKNNLMAFGFDCGCGWEGLVTELIQKLQELKDTKYPDLEVVQVKEKWGYLTVYLNYYYPEAEQLIDEYRDKSGTVCEMCGGPGKMKLLDGWYSVICDDCEDKLAARKESR